MARNDDGLVVIDCLTCGYAHLHPRPTQRRLDAWWRKYYASASGGRLLEQNPRHRWYWRGEYDFQVGLFDEVARKQWPDADNYTLVDWGAGLGEFGRSVDESQRWASSMRWYVYDHEPHAPNVYDRVRLTEDFPSQWNGWEGFAHAIRCSLVLEHLLDPLEELRQMYRVLKPGGVLALVVPNEFNPLQQQLVERFGYSCVHLTHVNYFTPGTLGALAKRAGFTPLGVRLTFPMEWLALHGFNYVRRPWMGPPAHWLRMLLETAMRLTRTKWRFERAMYRRGWGREVEMYAIKPPGVLL